MPTIGTISTLPDFTLVPASAGAGKTYALTQRYLQLLMRDNLPQNDLRNILAVTFTKNAAKEMKERILQTLQHAALGDEKAIAELQNIITADAEEIRNLATLYVDKILENYSYFQVQTIDSFITRVLKASAVELGLPPQFEVDFNTEGVLNEALDLFARELAADPAKQELLNQLVDLLSEQRTSDARYLWNPLESIARELRGLHRELSTRTGEPWVESAGNRFRELTQEIVSRLKQIGELGQRPGLVVSKLFADIIALAHAGQVDTVMGRKLSQKILNKPKGDYDEGAAAQIGKLQEEIGSFVEAYFALKSRTREAPYLQAYSLVRHSIEQIKQRREAVFLGEANRSLAQMIDAEIVPEIYFSLGEQIHHFLIDEFQDTSPIQWAVLRPLIEHSLGGRGSLFVVGDTKQSIYTFRGADWRIMKAMMERDEFASVKTRQEGLTLNWRSSEALVKFTKEVFQTRVPAQVDPDISDLSGLVSYRQEAREEVKGKGYVEVHVMEPPPKEEEQVEPSAAQPERERMLQILADCRARGYGFGDIAILTPRNVDVVEVSRWLNAEGIKFLSHSSLDIRTRTTTGELLALLRFLDSPVDDHAFASFVLGGVFGSLAERSGGERSFHEFIHRARTNSSRDSALYSLFRSQYPKLWEAHFERLFALVGYLPLYDLVAEIYRVFDLFAVLAEEEATLVKLLEVVRQFEANGNNSLKDFLAYADDEGGEGGEEWEIETAEQEDAVKVMTVHKAKGLGFPVLIALFYDRSPRPPNRFIVGDGEHVQLLHVTREWADKSPEVKQNYDQAFMLTQVDDLNKLYVALTRAREEMYILCVIQRRGDQPSAFLPEDGYSIGAQLRREQQHAREESNAEVAHLHTQGLAAESKIDPMNLVQKSRGEFIHNVLSEIAFLDADSAKLVAGAVERRKSELRKEFHVSELSKVVVDFLAVPEVAEYFAVRDGRTVLNEQDVVDRFGALHRIDRLVVDAETVTVLDYKTGDEKGTYNEQVREYMEIVKTMYPGKTVKGFLLYVDRKTVREVA